MDIITSSHNMSIDKQPIFNDVMQTPYKLPSTASDKEFYLKTNADSDALLAVKMDPAVLEAQVTVTQSQARDKYTPPPTPHTNTVARIAKTKQKKDVTQSSIFEAAVSMQQAALFSLTPDQFHLLLSYVNTLRRQRQTLMKQMECAFCKNNGHPEVWYTTHALRDTRGRVRCPVLRAHFCRRCGATGDSAHTLRYCPLNHCDHGTSECPRRNPAEETTPPSCVLCNTSGHTANYKGCNRAPQAKRRKVPPMRGAPPKQRYVPAPPPSKPAWGLSKKSPQGPPPQRSTALPASPTKVLPLPANRATETGPAKPSPTSNFGADIAFAAKFLSEIDSMELNVFVTKLRGSYEDHMSALASHTDLINKIKEFS